MSTANTAAADSSAKADAAQKTAAKNPEPKFPWAMAMGYVGSIALGMFAIGAAATLGRRVGLAGTSKDQFDRLTAVSPVYISSAHTSIAGGQVTAYSPEEITRATVQ